MDAVLVEIDAAHAQFGIIERATCDLLFRQFRLGDLNNCHQVEIDDLNRAIELIREALFISRMECRCR